MNTLILTFEQLSVTQLYDVLALRQEVFILEQQCLYNDIDGLDKEALHLLIYDRNNLAGYLRIFAPLVKFKESSLSRIVVSNDYRGAGVGKKLISTGIEVCLKEFSTAPIRIEAQAELLQYYKNYGFIEEGDVYLLDNINHVQMVLKEIV